MENAANIIVGKLGKPHGLSGAFRFILSRELKSKKKAPKHFLLEINGSYIPWFISNIEFSGFNEGLINFEEISSPELAKKYAGSEFFLSESDCNTYFKRQAQSIDYLNGYTVFTEGKVEVGVIEEIIDNPGQILLSVRSESREILIPLVDEFIVEINKKAKQIILQLPEGLIEIQ